MYDLAQIICSSEIQELLSASRIPAGTWGKERLIQPLLSCNRRFRFTRMRFNRRLRTFYLSFKPVLLSLFLCETKPICYMIYQAKKTNASLPNQEGMNYLPQSRNWRNDLYSRSAVLSFPKQCYMHVKLSTCRSTFLIVANGKVQCTRRTYNSQP